LREICIVLFIIALPCVPSACRKDMREMRSDLSLLSAPSF